MRYSLWENVELPNSGQGTGRPWGTATRWPSSSTSVSWVGSAAHTKGHSPVSPAHYAPHFCPRECLFIPTSPTSKPLHMLGLLPGLSSPNTLPGEHLLFFQCLVNDTSSLKPSWMPRTDLVNDCSEESCFFLFLSTAPSLLTSPP